MLDNFKFFSWQQSMYCANYCRYCFLLGKENCLFSFNTKNWWSGQVAKCRETFVKKTTLRNSEYWSRTNFKISTLANISFSTKPKVQDIDQTWLQNLDQDSTSLPLQNISSKMLTKFQLQILPELQIQNLDQILCSKSEQKFSFMNNPHSSAPKSATNCCQHDPHHQH